MKVLVTGGGGFVGSWIVRQLLERGDSVTILGRNNYPEMEKLGAQCIQGDIADDPVCEKAAEGVDLVYHVASLAGIWGRWRDYHRTNIRGTTNLLKSCRKQGVEHLVYTSTPSVVFDREPICGGDESLAYPDRFLCHYAKSKAEAEKMVLAANSPELKTCAIRPHLIWGPGDPHLLPRLVEAGRSGRLRIVGEGTNLVDVSYVENVAHAHLLAGDNLVSGGVAAGQSYFISQGEPVQLWEWINDLFARLEITPVRKKVTLRTALVAGTLQEALFRFLPKSMEPSMTRFVAEQLAKDHYFSIEKARRELGYVPPVSMSDGLERTVEWLKKQ